MAPRPPRTAVAWCPDWPVVATGASDPDTPVAVLVANRVIACSHAARAAGVRRGQRRREAQFRCPELTALPRDEAVEARAFEPVVVALESIAPGVEIVRPGLAAIGLRGPTRYFGGEDGALHALARAITEIAAGLDLGIQIGAADGSFAAEQAARRGIVVPAGGSPAFLADLPVETLELPDLVSLLRRLGLRTLGAFAALPARDVLARFGPDGAWAHRRAGGRDDRPPAGRRPPAELTVTLDLEPPVDRVDTVTFSARAAAERFVTGLAARGLTCTCLELRADSENGGQVVRRWRHAGVLSAGDVLDRVRWQLDGWRSGDVGSRAGSVTALRLTPIETVPLGTHQQVLWGGPGAGDERAQRALTRVQTLLGHGSVLTPALGGGRDPIQRSRLTPWSGAGTGGRQTADRPWPGQLPAPAPTVLFDPPRPIQVLDDAGQPVVVTERGAVPRPPARLVVDGQPAVPIVAWAGPWPIDEQWWSPDSARRAVRCQVVDVRGRAYLVSCRSGQSRPGWQADALYD